MLLVAHRPGVAARPIASCAWPTGALRHRWRCADHHHPPPPRARRTPEEAASHCSIALGALAVGFGVALIATAGPLISRAAGQPPILSLTTIITVRFLALAPAPLAYLERLFCTRPRSRGLEADRSSVYARIEPLARPSSLMPSGAATA